MLLAELGVAAATAVLMAFTDVSIALTEARTPDKSTLGLPAWRAAICACRLATSAAIAVFSVVTAVASVATSVCSCVTAAWTWANVVLMVSIFL